MPGVGAQRTHLGSTVSQLETCILRRYRFCVDLCGIEVLLRGVPHEESEVGWRAVGSVCCERLVVAEGRKLRLY